MDRNNSHPAKVKWDAKYRERGPEAFGLSPSDWLVRHEAMLQEQAKGPALDIACGNGRNSIYLARMGFQVEALDISSVATDWLNKEAVEQKLPIAARSLDITAWEFPPDRYQLIINFNFLERSIFPGIVKALAPGGLLLFETFLQDPDFQTSMNARFLLKPNELLRAFSGFRVLHYLEGPSAKGAMRAGILARKVTDMG